MFLKKQRGKGVSRNEHITLSAAKVLPNVRDSMRRELKEINPWN